MTPTTSREGPDATKEHHENEVAEEIDLAHLRRTRPGLFPPPRASPAATPTLCRADADGVLFAQEFPPDV